VRPIQSTASRKWRLSGGQFGIATDTLWPVAADAVNAWTQPLSVIVGRQVWASQNNANFPIAKRWRSMVFA